jgi:hypothetical protein
LFRSGEFVKTLRRLVISFSFANLCYIRAWSSLVGYSRTDSFFMSRPPSNGQLASLMASVTLLALLAFLAGSLMARLQGRFAAAGRLVFLLALCIPLNGFRELLSENVGVLRAELFRVIPPILVAVLLAAIVTVLIFGMIRWQYYFVKVSSYLLLICAPFCVFNFAHAAEQMTHHEDSAFEAHQCAEPLPVQPGQPRVIFVLFDEWDYRLTFIDHGTDLTTPELDRLRREALFATKTTTPNRSTTVSVPSLLTGKLVTNSWPGGVAELLLQFDGARQPVSFGSTSTIFSDARKAGVNSRVIGWYIPYCRILTNSLVNCWWKDMGRQYNSTGYGFAQNMINQTRGLFETSLFSIFGQSLVVQRRTQTYEQAMAETNEALVDPALGLLYIHYGIPHPPYFYNKLTRKFDLKNSAVTGYRDNIALVDRTIGSIRRRLEEANLWDASTVLFTSDHEFRTSRAIDGKSDMRVPFILKMAGAHTGMELNVPFNNILIHDLLLKTLQRQISTPQDAAGWIQQQAPLQSSRLRHYQPAS